MILSIIGNTAVYTRWLVNIGKTAVMKQDTRIPEKLGQVSVQRKLLRRFPKRRLLAGFCVLLCCIATAIFAYQFFSARYRQDLAAVHQGTQELQVAVSQMGTLRQDPLNLQNIASAQRHLTQASAAFTRVQADLAFAPDFLTFMPGIGSHIYTAKHLVELAKNATQGGLEGCKVMKLLISGLDKQQRLGTADLTELVLHLDRLKFILNQAAQEAQPSTDLQIGPNINYMLDTFHHYLPLIQQGLRQVEALTSSSPRLLGIGKPAYYLIEILDSTELRPGGGFIGNYGIATLTGGHLVSAQVTDTYLLDDSFDRTNTQPYPPEYRWFQRVVLKKWSLRDSNLDADFPTAARNATLLYSQEGGKLPLAGVLAITPRLIEHILTLTGPITVPAYHEIITAQNLIERIHYHQSTEEAQKTDTPSADGYSSARKHFTALLGVALLARLQRMSVASRSLLLRECITSVQTRDLQIYFHVDAAEQALHSYHIDGAVQAPIHDGIFVVDANITPNKANQYLVTTVHDQTTLDAAGTASHQTQIEFQWTTPMLKAQNLYGSTRYRDYLRVYIPARSILLTQSGWSNDASGHAFGNAFWSGYASIDYPQTKIIRLTWRVEHVATLYAQHWHYQELLQHQAGAQQNIDLHVTLQTCGTLVTSPAMVQENNQKSFYIVESLTQDKVLNINYKCR